MNRIARGPLARRASDRLPANHRPASAYRLGWGHRAEPGASRGQVRDVRLAALEAVLLAADEPLNARKLAAVVGLQDGTEARRLVRKLQGYYDQDGTAFQLEELAGGFQLLTRPEYHPWLVRLRRTGNDLRL